MGPLQLAELTTGGEYIKVLVANMQRKIHYSAFTRWTDNIVTDTGSQWVEVI